MDFVREKLIPEEYSFLDLETLVQNLEIDNFDDSLMICKEIIINKRKKLERKYNYIDIALG